MTAVARSDALKILFMSIILNAIGQILFKTARAGQPDASLISVFLRPEIWIGILFYGLSALCWLHVLARTQLSYAYPILALTFPIIVALSSVLFAEPVSLVRWLGVGVIMIGVSLLART